MCLLVWSNPMVSSSTGIFNLFLFFSWASLWRKRPHEQWKWKMCKTDLWVTGLQPNSELPHTWRISLCLCSLSLLELGAQTLAFSRCWLQQQVKDLWSRFWRGYLCFFFFPSLNWYRVLCVSLNGFNWQKLPGATERNCWQINHLCDPKKDAMEENKCPSFIWKLAFGTEVTWKWSSWGMVLLVCLSKSLACRFGLGPQCSFSGKQQPPSPQQWLLSYFFRVVSQLISFDNCVSLWLSGG